MTLILGLVKTLLLIVITFTLSNTTFANSEIKLNQIGFLPHASKIAVVPNVESGEFWLISASDKSELLRGPLSVPQDWKVSGETVKVADFSSFDRPGRYYLRVDGVKDSHVFSIVDGVYDDILNASIKSFYYNRSGAAIEERFGGKHARPAGHPDSLVYVHPSAASKARPSDTTLSSEKGWYDAGDYNKYIVNSGISTYTLLKTYEDFEPYFKALSLDIPESKNHIPDLIDEILWNLEWMYSMQDPEDGGVYHKLTTQRFTSTGMPHEQNQARYLVQKSTAAALNFAAVMSKASQLFAKNQNWMPGYAEKFGDAALHAWKWAEKNPKISYIQPADVRTGTYADPKDNLKDEWLWAATEMFKLTGKKSMLNGQAQIDALRILEWGQVEHLAWFTLARDAGVPVTMKKHAKKQLLALADKMVRDLWASGYFVPMIDTDFRWGSNAIALNKAIILLEANKIQEKTDYLSAARALLDYVLGRNATGYSFVTGFGSKRVMYPHHRISHFDNIKEPLPGMLVGGPHAGQQDDCKYPSKLPARSFIDGWCSYSTNEVAINWNAALVYMLAALRTDLQTKPF